MWAGVASDVLFFFVIRFFDGSIMKKKDQFGAYHTLQNPFHG